MESIIIRAFDTIIVDYLQLPFQSTNNKNELHNRGYKR